MQQGLVVDIENITVPAGTFSARKLQHGSTSTNIATTATTVAHLPVWYDVASGRKVQATIDYSYLNTTFTTGYRTHEVQQLLTPP